MREMRAQPLANNDITGERPVELKSVSELRRQQRVKATQLFLKGPIPMAWLATASRLGRAALATGISLWHQYGLHSGGVFSVSLSKLALGKMSQAMVRRGVQALEEAGLIEIERLPGRKNQYTILNTSIAQLHHPASEIMDCEGGNTP